MKRPVLILVVAVALAVLAYALRDHQPAAVVTPSTSPEPPVVSAPADESRGPDEAQHGAMVELPVVVDEFTIVLPPQNYSGDDLYRQLRNAVDSIPEVHEVERDAIAPSLTLPPLPEPTVEDDEEDRPPPDPSG